MKRICLVLLMALVIGSLVFAGGGGEKGGSAGGDGKVTVTVLTTVTTQNPEGPLAEKYIAEFQAANPNVTIEVLGVPMNQALTRITTLAAADSLPDLFVNTENLRGKLYDMGITDDFGPYLSAAEKNNILDAIRESCTIDGKLVIYPWYTAPNAVLYRSDWLAAKGLSEPQNWDDFLKIAQAFTEDTDKDGKIDRWGFGMVGTNDDSGQWRFVQVLRGFGARDLYFENGQWKTEIGSPASVNAFRYFTELKTKYNVVPPGSLENSFNENVSLFAGEQIGLIISGPHTTGKVFDMNPSLRGKLGSVIVPMGVTRYTPLSVLGFSMNPSSKVKKEAVEFVKFLTTKDRMVEWVETTGRMPCFKDASDADYMKTPLFKGFNESVATQEMVPDAPFYPEIRTVLGRTYQKIMLNPGIDIQKEVTDAGRQIQTIINQNS
ncbi:ABC transporter substrate-binding protein [Breznakiella homolactica]|uniref:Sugar ABC transporter substrate-binding protein n=1 Tax=Breznakiella homolactica TaxID=2798577 RepID=A0A7T8BBT9_9SPIR|nr:sugar ABC transporter substrate-binding protein [Breznakiella homolactica]QQO10731.1 sugar ABC transporter substrate-binding protein [Breznakiella homolactica]